MEKIEKIAYPLMIAAAILGIIVFFRKQPAPIVQTVTAPNATGYGAIPPLTQTLVQPTQVSPSPSVFYAAITNPYSPAPQTNVTDNVGSVPPSYLTFNQGPDNSLIKAVQAVDTQLPTITGPNGSPVKSGGCGCGGSCGGCSSAKTCKSPCDIVNARYPDGRGGCLVSKIPASASLKQAANLGDYLATVNDNKWMAGYAAIVDKAISA